MRTVHWTPLNVPEGAPPQYEVTGSEAMASSSLCHRSLRLLLVLSAKERQLFLLYYLLRSSFLKYRMIPVGNAREESMLQLQSETKLLGVLYLLGHRADRRPFRSGAFCCRCSCLLSPSCNAIFFVYKMDSHCMFTTTALLSIYCHTQGTASALST